MVTRVVEVPASEIRGVREARWSLGAYNWRDHLILKLADGVEVGFNVRDHSQWMELFRKKLYSGRQRSRTDEDPRLLDHDR